MNENLKRRRMNLLGFFYYFSIVFLIQVDRPILAFNKDEEAKKVAFSQETEINYPLPEISSDSRENEDEQNGQLNQPRDKKIVAEEKKEQKPNILFRFHEEIVVTATSTPISLKNCPVSATVVGQEILKSQNVSNAINALLFEPGVFIMKTGDFGRADLEIRGLGQRGQRIGLMIDGRPEKMALFGCVVTQTFPLDNVEKIEIIRGPASIFYGSDALGGVVNIITRTPQRGFETEAVVSLGSYDTRRVSLHHGAGFKKITYYFTFDHSQSDGHLDNSAYSANNFTGKIEAQIFPSWRLTLGGKYYDGIKHEPIINFPILPLANWFKYKRGATDLNLRGQFNRLNLNVKFYSTFGRHRFANGWDSADYIYGGIFKTNFSLGSNNSFTLGGDLRSLEGESFNHPRGKWSRREGGFFIYNEHFFQRRVMASAGFRLNFDSVYGLEVAPGAALIVSPHSRTTFRALVNKGFRSPQLNELYLFPASNPSLKPEKIWNYEIGLNYNLMNLADLNLNFFIMNGFDFIETRKNPTPPPAFKMINVGRYRAKGLESALYVYFGDCWLSRVSFTYLNPGENTQGKAGQKYDFSLIFKQDKVFSALNAQYVTDYYADNNKNNRLPSFFLLNFKVEWPLTKYFFGFLSIDNLLNEKYSLYVNLPEGAGIFPMPGRAIYFGLRIKP